VNGTVVNGNFTMEAIVFTMEAIVALAMSHECHNERRFSVV
jgi:hypothetical protein